MEAPRYYACRVRLDGATAFVVWYSADRDGFLRDTGRRLVAARTPEALAEAARARGITLEDTEPAGYDFDRIRAWCACPDPAGVDCPAFLDAWNFLDDLGELRAGADRRYARLSRGASRCYDRLFWGSNLPAVTPPGERFDPAWSAEELAAIRRVFEAGLGVLRAELAASVPGAEQAAAADRPRD
jgi:hypothetical protein